MAEAGYTRSTMLPEIFSTLLPLMNNESTVAPKNGSDSGSEGVDECSAVDHIPGIVSKDMSHGLHEFAVNYASIHGYVAVAVCLFGVLSNSANIIVLTRKNMASSTNTLLLWLAVSDLLTMLSYLPFATHYYVMEPQDPRRPPFSTPEFSWICFLMFHASFSIVCHSIAIWLTIALAIFRYIYICKPTSGAYYCSQQRARYVVILVIVLAIIICIPNYAVNTYEFIPNPTDPADVNISSGNVSSFNHAPTPAASEMNTQGGFYFPAPRKYTATDKVVIQINNWLQAILIKLVPCGMLTTLTLLLVHAMHKAYRKRLKLKSQGRKAESDKHGEHNRTTGMLLAVVILFTLTELPQGILTLMNIFVKCFTQIVYYRLGDLLDIMALINNSVNFVLYCTMSTQFRTTFTAIFCPARTTRPKWLKLKLIRSRKSDKSSIEVSAKDKDEKANNNGRLQVVNMEDPVTLVTSDLNCKESNHEPSTDEVPSQEDNDKIPLTPEDTNGTATHTHGYSPLNSHV